MATTFWRKEHLSNQYLVGGAAVPFEQVGDNQGIAAFDSVTDKAIVDGLMAATQKRVGGIVRSTEAEYAELKKKAVSKPSPQRSNPLDDRLKVMPSDLNPFNRKADAAPVKPELPVPATASASSAGVSIETQGAPAASAAKAGFKPRTAKLDPNGKVAKE